MVAISVVTAIITVAIFIFILNYTVFHGALREIAEQTEIIEERFHDSEATIKARITLIGLLTVVGFIALIYVTNRFLTRFVFNKVEQPLDMLSYSVQQISGGNLDYRIAYYTDDEFKSICDNFNEMAVRLKDLIEEVRKNEQNKKELIASISHDLRSPLTSIKAFVEGLIDEVANTPEMRLEYLETIRTKTDDIDNMITKLFLFSKMDMGSYPVYPEKLDIGKEIADFTAVSREDYKDRGLSIETSSIPEERYVYADPTQLYSVFSNIIENSTKYKNKDTVAVFIRCEVINGIIKIVFEDNGPGVSAETLPKLFDVFYRGDPSRTNPRRRGAVSGLPSPRKLLNV